MNQRNSSWSIDLEPGHLYRLVKQPDMGADYWAFMPTSVFSNTVDSAIRTYIRLPEDSLVLVLEKMFVTDHWLVMCLLPSGIIGVTFLYEDSWGRRVNTWQLQW